MSTPANAGQQMTLQHFRTAKENRLIDLSARPPISPLQTHRVAIAGDYLHGEEVFGWLSEGKGRVKVHVLKYRPRSFLGHSVIPFRIHLAQQETEGFDWLHRVDHSKN